MNNDKNKVCRFIQTWIVPDRTEYDDSKVRYGAISMKRSDRLNLLFHAISPLNSKIETPIAFRRDCNVLSKHLYALLALLWCFLSGFGRLAD